VNHRGETSLKTVKEVGNKKSGLQMQVAYGYFLESSKLDSVDELEIAKRSNH
jgi:hypothetical protein